MTKPNHRDALLKASIALPNGAATVNSPAIDLGNGPNGDLVAGGELILEMPALTVGELANGATITYNIQDSVDPAFSSPRTLASFVQTGAGGAGAAAGSNRRGLASDTRRYIRVQAINSAAGNASAKTTALSCVFQA
jgi:hypothetical protein